MRIRFVAVLAGAWVVGCAHQGTTLPSKEDGAFRIGREDVLDVAVWHEPDLSRVVPVRPDGLISLPMLGELKAEGRTPTELAEDVQQKLAPLVQEPKVTVIVREVNSTRVYVTGEVGRPGSYPLRNRMSVLQAVALAGGFSTFADRDSIVVIRPGHEGGRFAVRYTDLISDEKQGREAYLQAGDTVVVP